MDTQECKRRIARAFKSGRKAGLWLAFNGPQAQQQARQADVRDMRRQDVALEEAGLGDVFGQAEQNAAQRDRFRGVRRPVRAVPAAPAAPAAPAQPESARIQLARIYANEAYVMKMLKDAAREAYRAIGGNPRKPGSGDYRPLDEVKRLLIAKARQILNE